MSVLTPVLMAKRKYKIFPVNHSVHLDGASSATRTQVAPTDNKKLTLSLWMKRGKLATTQGFFSAGASGGDRLFFDSSDQFNYWQGGTAKFIGPRFYRDPTAWMHMLWVQDSTIPIQQLFINGRLVDQNNNLTLNQALGLNTNALAQTIAKDVHGNTFFDGYIAEVHFIDGQYLPYTDFTDTDPISGAIIPKRYTGSYGNNGFYLKMDDSSSVTNFGKDRRASGTNHFTWTGISVSGSGRDDVPDVPVNFSDAEGDHGNFPTWNHLDGFYTGTISNGNLTAQLPSDIQIITTMHVPNEDDAGWYWEVTCVSGRGVVGIGYTQHLNTNGLEAGNWGYYGPGGTKYSNGVAQAFGATYTTGDIIGVAFKNGKVWFSKNGVWQGSGDPSNGLNPAFAGISNSIRRFPMASATHNNPVTKQINCGQRPFAFTPPTGFKKLCSVNMIEPEVIPEEYIASKPYVGAASSQALSTGFAPDMFILREINAAYWREFDTKRSADNIPLLGSTSAEAAAVSGFSLDATQVTVPANTADVSETGVQYHGLALKEIPGALDIFTYTGNGAANRSLSHGLGVTPEFIMIKAMNTTGSWYFWHKNFTSAAHFQIMENAGAMSNTTSPFGTGTKSPTILTISNAGNTNGVTYLCIVIASKRGVVDVGYYNGDGTATGPFVYMDLQPAYVWISPTNGTYPRLGQEAFREDNPVGTHILCENIADSIMGSTYEVDFCAAGMKIKGVGAYLNSAEVKRYVAFARAPFKHARADTR